MSDNSIIVLRKCDEFAITPTQPFHCAGTIWKPSHFPAPVEQLRGDCLRFAMRVDNQTLGIRLRPKRIGPCDAISVSVYSRDAPPPREIIESELRWRFDLDADLSGFLNMGRKDKILRGAVRRWRGMRVKCNQNTAELLVISVALQNATVRRSVQMLDALLRRYGTRVRFDRTELYGFWKPDRLATEDEQTLRAMKMGYRAKTFIRQSASFTNPSMSDAHLRRLSFDELRERLLELYGVGPASVGILLFESFHHYDCLDHIAPWEQQIYSKLLFGKDRVSVKMIFRRIEAWRPWRMLAMHYLFEDLFWRHHSRNVKWLERLIRL